MKRSHSERHPMTATLRARPTIYRGIRMRSRLEAAWAEQFDAFGWPWEYEPQAFASELGQYLPDFRIEVAGQRFYVEVKPGNFSDPQAYGFTLEGDSWNEGCALIRSFWQPWVRIIHASEPAARLLIATGANAHDCVDLEEVVDIEDRCNDTIHYCPVVRAGRVELAEWDSLGSWWERRNHPGIPKPVASLHSREFWGAS